MATDITGVNTVSGEALAPASDLVEYGAMIVRELDKAEGDLDDGENQPFSGMSAAVMQDIAHLRNRQFDMFRRHVEIEQGYKMHEAVSDDDVQRMTFSGIATTMRKKESATAGLLNRLADFDAQLRAVMDKFDTAATGNPDAQSNAESGGASPSNGSAEASRPAAQSLDFNFAPSHTPQSQPQLQSQSHPQPQSHPQSESPSQPQPQSLLQSQTQSPSQSQTQTQSPSPSLSHPQLQLQLQPQLQPQPKPQPKPIRRSLKRSSASTSQL